MRRLLTRPSHLPGDRTQCSSRNMARSTRYGSAGAERNPAVPNRLREDQRGLIDRFEKLDHRLAICWVGQGIDTAGACAPMSHVLEHIVERWGVPAVQVRRSSTDREERR